MIQLVKLFLLAALALPASAQAPFQKTQGPITIFATDWEPSASVPQWLSARSGNPFGLWVTACTTDGTMPTKAVVTIRVAGREVTHVGKFSNPPHGCGSVMIPDVRRSDVLNLLIVTTGMEFNDIR